MIDSCALQQYLVDPELLIPDELYESDEDFWLRMCRVPDFRPYAALGPYTRSMFDDFFAERLDDIFSALGFLSNPDVCGLYGLLDRMPSFKLSDVKGELELTGAVYRPKYGKPENLFTAQCDINETGATCVLTESTVWDRCEMSRNAVLKDIVIADIHGNKNQPKSDLSRNVISNNPSYLTLEQYASDAFPNLHFCNETWSMTRKLAGDERDNARIMLNYFSTLNDNALDIWEKEGDNHKRISRMSALGVDCTPENGETDKNNKRVIERRFWLGNEQFDMNWHAKLFRNRNRMYFVVDSKKKRIVIGGLTEHFATR